MPTDFVQMLWRVRHLTTRRAEVVDGCGRLKNENAVRALTVDDARKSIRKPQQVVCAAAPEVAVHLRGSSLPLLNESFISVAERNGRAAPRKYIMLQVELQVVSFEVVPNDGTCDEDALLRLHAAAGASGPASAIICRRAAWSRRSAARCRHKAAHLQRSQGSAQQAVERERSPGRLTPEENAALSAYYALYALQPSAPESVKAAAWDDILRGPSRHCVLSRCGNFRSVSESKPRLAAVTRMARRCFVSKLPCQLLQRLALPLVLEALGVESLRLHEEHTWTEDEHLRRDASGRSLVDRLYATHEMPEQAM